MDQRSFSRSILSCIHMAEAMGLSPEAINPSSLPNNAELRQLVDNNCSYLEYYQRTVDLRHVNFFVGAGDVFQFSLFEGRRSFSVRYAFFGSPYRNNTAEQSSEDQDQTVVHGEPGADAEESHVDAEAGPSPNTTEQDGDTGGDSPEADGGAFSVRYEYAEHEYRRLVHPCAHLHLGWRRDGRLPVRRIWTPQIFLSFITRNLFAARWFNSQDSNVTDMDGFENEIMLKRERGRATKISDKYFHSFEEEVLYLD